MSNHDKIINITIEGQVGSGKTAVMNVIEHALRGAYPEMEIYAQVLRDELQVSSGFIEPSKETQFHLKERSLPGVALNPPAEKVGISQILNLIVKAREAVAIEQIESGLWAAETCKLLPAAVELDVARIKQVIRGNDNPFVGFDDEQTENLQKYLTICSKDFIKREIQALTKTIEFLKPYSE